MSRTNDAPVQDEKREQRRREEPSKEANKIKQDDEQDSRNKKRKEKQLPPCRRSDIGLLAETQMSDQGVQDCGLRIDDARCFSGPIFVGISGLSPTLCFLIPFSLDDRAPRDESVSAVVGSGVVKQE